MFSPSVVVLLAIIVPIALLRMTSRIRMRRYKARLAEKNSAVSEVRGLGQESLINIFLSRFPLPEQTYLKEQIPLARYGFYCCTYVIFVISAISLLPDSVHEYSGHTLADTVWFSYSNGLKHTELGIFFLAAIAAIVSISNQLPSAGAGFTRTRPILHRFMFYSRTLLALASFLASVLAGLLVSFVILVAAYGPIWLHRKADPGEQALAVTWLGILVIAMCIFSVLVALCCLQQRPRKTTGRWSLPVMGVLGGFVGSEISHLFRHHLWENAHPAKLIALMQGTPANTIEVLALGMAFSAFSLWLGQKFAARIEI